MNEPQTILLIGLRGSGKSTLGRMLADRLGIGFEDLDALTLRAMGFDTVAGAWEAAGEGAFRAVEVAALAGAIGRAATTGGVIALGGGTPMSLGAEAVIRDAGAMVVYLRGEPAILRARLSDGPGDDRPSLTGADPLAEIDRVFRDRDGVYRAIADSVVELPAHEQPDQTLSRLVGLVR
jgi:shikimate kinase